MLFNSAEIRWFSKNRKEFWDIYSRTTPEGNGVEEKKRSDHYLKIPSANTGIKIREGKHEIKARSVKSIPGPNGNFESWKKWSYREEKNILDQIKEEHRGDWIEIQKKRFIKKFEITGNRSIKFITTEIVDEGCGFEFTELYLPEFEEKYYTIGLEAFSSSGNCMSNLKYIIQMIELDMTSLKKEYAMSYPEFINSLLV